MFSYYENQKFLYSDCLNDSYHEIKTVTKILVRHVADRNAKQEVPNKQIEVLINNTITELAERKIEKITS